MKVRIITMLNTSQKTVNETDRETDRDREREMGLGGGRLVI